jgi:dolichol-phosphate mannosyltransferase
MPTYNEAANIEPMIEALFTVQFPRIKDHLMSLLVVDDHSPDGTWKIVETNQKKFKELYLSDSKIKRGLGGAYTDGFEYAINRLKADAVMEMDADFQHDPADIKRFIAEFDRGYDYVLGTRLSAGGSIPKDWELKRKFLSVVGNLFTQVTLLEFGIHDFTTGYRLSRVRGFLDQMDFHRIFSTKSYAYKMLLLEEMRRRGAKIKEIPITFTRREKGWSKMDGEDFKESLKAILTIWMRRLGKSY